MSAPEPLLEFHPDLEGSDDSDQLSVAGEYDRRPNTSRKHFEFVDKFGKGLYYESELLEQEVRDNVDLEMIGQGGSTILHVMAERWSSRMKDTFTAIMKRYPAIYRVEDDLRRTVIEKAKDGRGATSRFVDFFATEFSKETVDLLLADERSSILKILLPALKNIAAWERLLHHLGKEILENRWGGHPFLHYTVAYIAQSKPQGKDSELLNVVQAILHKVPESLTQLNKGHLSAYQYHRDLYEKGGAHEALNIALAQEQAYKRDEEGSKPLSPKDRVEKSIPTLRRMDKIQSQDLKPLKDKPEQLDESEEKIDQLNSRDSTTQGPMKAIAKPFLSRSRNKSGKSEEYIRQKLQINADIARLLQLEMLRSVDAEDMPSLLYQGDNELEFDLDLSEMDQNDGNEFRQDVITMVESLSFDQILRSVRIPGLSKSKHTKSTIDSDTVANIFKCLYYRKAVTHIIHLEVGSDPDLAESDDAIIQSLEHIEVDELDWKKTDISSHVLLQAAPNVRRIHLYSSGNMGVLKSWAAEDGLCRLCKLKEVSISVMSRTEPPETIHRYTTQFQSMMQKNSPELPMIKIYTYNHSDGWLSALGGLGRNRMETVHMRGEWIQRLFQFGAGVSKLSAYGGNFPRVKVAMLGDGIAPTRFPDRIAAGKSFIRNRAARFQPFKPYYLSSTDHGANMAAMILQACPGAFFYVARVMEVGNVGSESSLPQKLAEAIDWAITHMADIIYFGVGLSPGGDPDGLKLLNNSLQKARACRILVLGPSNDGDAGTLPPSAALRSLEMVRIAPTSQTGGIRPPWEVNEQDYDFIMPGEFMLDNNQLIYGSSVAAALATGLAATLLLVSRLAHLETGRNQELTPIKIVEVFKILSNDTKFVFLDELDTRGEEYRVFEIFEKLILCLDVG